MSKQSDDWVQEIVDAGKMTLQTTQLVTEILWLRAELAAAKETARLAREHRERLEDRYDKLDAENEALKERIAALERELDRRDRAQALAR